MVGRREERRRLAEELLERRKNENKSNKRSKSRDRGAIDLKGKCSSSFKASNGIEAYICGRLIAVYLY